MLAAQASEAAIDFREREMLVLQETNQPKPIQMLFRIPRARASRARRREQALLDVVMNRPRRDASAFAQLLDVKIEKHCGTMTVQRLTVKLPGVCGRPGGSLCDVMFKLVDSDTVRLPPARANRLTDLIDRPPQITKNNSLIVDRFLESGRRVEKRRHS